MNLAEVNFPLYKLREYINIDKDLLGRVKITSIRGTYILDDLSYNGIFEERRVKMLNDYSTKEIYTLKERVNFLRQLVKYKSGSTFIDNDGSIIKYKKSSKLFTITSYKIVKFDNRHNWTIVYPEGFEQGFLIPYQLKYNDMYVSIMDTEWGPFLYNLTTEKHTSYKRKI